MSMNVFCQLKSDPFTVVEHLDLVETPDEVSFAIVFFDGDFKKGLRPWRESAKLYLEWLTRQYGWTPNTLPPDRPVKGTSEQRRAGEDRGKDSARPAVVKRQRTIIGKAWRKAEEMENGSLFFGVS